MKERVEKSIMTGKRVFWISSLCLVCAGGVTSVTGNADDYLPETVFEEEFDGYGNTVECFSPGVSVSESPASLKHLSVRPEGGGAVLVRKTPFLIPVDRRSEEFTVDFLMSFPQGAERNFEVRLLFEDSPGLPPERFKTVIAQIDGKRGSKLSGALVPSRIGTLNLTPLLAEMPPFPDRLWHRVEISASGEGPIRLFVERDGKLRLESQGELPPGWRLAGVNFASRHALNLDSIRVTRPGPVSLAGGKRSPVEKGKEGEDHGNPAKGQETATGENNAKNTLSGVALSSASDVIFPVSDKMAELRFSVKTGVYPAKFQIRIEEGDAVRQEGAPEGGKKAEPVVYTLSSFAQDDSRKVLREVTENKDGKTVWTARFVDEAFKLPDSGMLFSGPGAGSFRIYTRPRLKYRYTAEQKRALLSRWDECGEEASEHHFQFRLTRTPSAFQLWLDGRFLCDVPDLQSVRSLTLSLPAGARYSVREVTDPQRSSSSSGILSSVPDLQLPLSIAECLHGCKADPSSADTGKEKGENGSRASSEGLLIGGVYFRDFPSDAAFRTAHCRENLGSFMLECDGYLSRSAFDGISENLLIRVPCAQYVRAHVLCSFDGDPRKTSDVTARLTRYLDNGGRSPAAMAQQTVTLPRSSSDPLPPNVRKAGTVPGDSGRDLYLVSFDLPAGQIQDLIFMENSPFLDFEVLGGLYEKDNYYLSRAEKPSLKPSGVLVHAATLERSPVSFRVFSGRPGNVYYPDESAFMTAELTAEKPGRFLVEWDVRDRKGRHLHSRTDSVDFASAGETRSLRMDFPGKACGYYPVRVSLREASEASGKALLSPIVSFEGAYARIPADTRKAGYESPYFVWNFNGAHGTPKDPEIFGDILKRMGVRRTLPGKRTEEELKPFGLTLGQFRSLRAKGNTPEERAADLDAQIRELRKNYPHTDMALIFHESGGGPVPLELIGGKTELTPQVAEQDRKRVQAALEIADAWTRNAPDVRLVIGNSGDSIALLAQLFRGKYPADKIDAMGEESVGMTMPPERSVAYANWQLRELARIYGYEKLRPEACFEWKSRVIRHFGPEKHAEMRVRDILVGHAWQMKLLPVIGISEMANSYYNTIWGDSAFTRYPLLQPYPVFPATAVMTQVLDSVDFLRMVPTGSPTVYALEFKRGSSFIHALWTARGTVGATLETDASSLRRISLYGEESVLSPLSGKDGEAFALEISEEPCYLVSESPVRKLTVAMERTYPRENYPGSEKALLVEPMNSTAGWKLVTGTDKRLEAPLNPLYLSAMRPGKFTLSAVKDEIRGDCLELRLIPEGDCPALMREYAFLRMDSPVPVPGTPNTLGLWVKGNSSWGKIYFELLDADGETWISAGTGGYGCQVYDWPELMGINFDGWHFLQFPLTAQSPVKIYSPGENQWQWQHDGTGDRKLTWPLKLKGIGFALSRQTLNLVEMEPVSDLSIRLQNFSAY